MKMFRILGRSIRDSFKSVFRNFSLSIASIACTTITLILVSVALVVSHNVNNVTEKLESELSIVVYLNKETTLEQVDIVETKIKNLENVDSVEYKSKDEWKVEMQSYSETLDTTLSYIESNPLLDSFVVTVDDVKNFGTTAEAIRTIEYVESADYGAGMVDQIVNIFDIIEKPKHIKEEGIALTQAQQIYFINLCDKNEYGHMFKFILYQGLRIGEALALTYKDIDFNNKTININKQLTPDGIVEYTKNQQSTRTIPLFNKSKNLIRFNNNSNERIFNINYRIANYNLNKIIENHNLPKITPHDLRHTFITNCKIKNIPEHVIQAIVGHEIGSKVTKQVYTHFNLEDNLSYIDKLND